MPFFEVYKLNLELTVLPIKCIVQFIKHEFDQNKDSYFLENTKLTRVQVICTTEDSLYMTK